MPNYGHEADADSDKDNFPPLHVPLLPFTYRRRVAEWHNRMGMLFESVSNMHFEAVDMWLELPYDESYERSRSAIIIPSQNADIFLVCLIIICIVLHNPSSI